MRQSELSQLSELSGVSETDGRSSLARSRGGVGRMDGSTGEREDGAGKKLIELKWGKTRVGVRLAAALPGLANDRISISL